MIPIAQKTENDKNEKDKRFPVRKINKSDFKFMSLIGSGSYGNVFLVEKIHGIDAGRLYAMKVIDKQKVTYNINMKNCANMERKALIQLADCPYVVHLYYAFQTEKKLYLAMDFAQGGELNALIGRDSRLSEEKTKIIAAEIVTAFEKIQEMNILYRDFKLENILLDHDGHILIADFGLVKIVQPKARTYTVCGTLEYMAPEMYDKSKGHDLRSDWHSIGAVLVEVLQGVGPYQHLVDGDNYSTAKRIIQNTPRLPKFISTDATNFLKQLLRKDPSKRLTSIAEIKQHPFFRGIDWVAVKNKTHSSFMTPELKSRTDLSQFCTTFTTQAVDDFIDESKPIDPEDDENFKEYYYVAPSLIEYDYRPPLEDFIPVESPIIPFSDVLTQGNTSTQISDSPELCELHDSFPRSRPQTNFNMILKLYKPLFELDSSHSSWKDSSIDVKSSLDNNKRKIETSNETESETSSDESLIIDIKPVKKRVSKLYVNKRRLPIDETNDESHVSKMPKLDEPKDISSKNSTAENKKCKPSIDILELFADYITETEKFPTKKPNPGQDKLADKKVVLFKNSDLMIINDSFCKFNPKSPAQAIAHIKKNYVDNKRRNSWIQIKLITYQGVL